MKAAAANVVIQFGPTQRLNFRVQRRSAKSKIFDLIVCTKNLVSKGDSCAIYDVNTAKSPLEVR